MYFIRLGRLSIVGSSPEMLVRVEGRRAETHPIAGTRPRGTNEEDDLRLGEELKRNEKERAEHVMLVDLGRNDLGRVCQFGSVRVPQYMALERYSHAVRQHAIEAERVQVDAIVHDSVLTTLLSAARADTPEAKELAATMAGNAIGHLRDAVAVAPDTDAQVPAVVLFGRISEAAATM